MKSAAMLLLLVCATIVASAAPLRTERLGIFGRDYYRLNEWARANGFQHRWLGRKDVELSKAGTRIRFTGDSENITFNGVDIRLAHAIVVKDGVAYITPLDVSQTLSPLIWPPRGKPGAQVKRICIDPGHGGKDTGKRVGREEEKKYTLLLAQELGEQLRKAGYTVSFTRTTDAFVDLSPRADIANRRRADLFISVHFNAFPKSTVRGAETYCLTPQGAPSSNDSRGVGNKSAVAGNQNNANNIVLAYEIHRAVTRSLGSEDRAVKRARFEVLREAEMPAVLIEAGFMSNPTEAKKIFSASWRRQLATAIVSGVSSYRKIVER
jgi:N-acetylmuramoyl-L-alanine amidase